MALKQMLLEIGMGVDLHGRDYTKAACRAVDNAIRHNSMKFIRHFASGPEQMYVHVIISVPQPDKIDKEKVLSILPFGTKSLEAVPGGLEISGQDPTIVPERDISVVANAAVIVSLDLP